VLVVDDDADARELAGMLLRKAGAKVMLASDVKSALATFDVFEPHVVISDIRMEEADGNDFVRALRQSKHSKVPALALSGNSDDSDARRAIDSGFDAYLVKPVAVQTLIDAVAKAAAMGRS
jgi:CheY-like chemotaxis protein